jgi:hypothetical protein
VPIFAFLSIGTGLAFVYAGWLGVPVTEVVRDLFTGTPLPARRGVLESKADVKAKADAKAQADAKAEADARAQATPNSTLISAPATPAAPIYPAV